MHVIEMGKVRYTCNIQFLIIIYSLKLLSLSPQQGGFQWLQDFTSVQQLCPLGVA